MAAITFRTLASMAIALLLGMSMAMAASRTLSDSELDGVYAAGFNVTVDFVIDLTATNPDAVLVQGGNPAALQQFFDHGMTLARSRDFGETNLGSLDPSGVYMPNLQNLVVNNINISDGALSNATTLMNIFALQGDIAVGLNLNVVVNPVNSAFNITQTNINWSNIGLSDAFLTPAVSGSN